MDFIYVNFLCDSTRSVRSRLLKFQTNKQTDSIMGCIFSGPPRENYEENYETFHYDDWNRNEDCKDDCNDGWNNESNNDGWNKTYTAKVVRREVSEQLMNEIYKVVLGKDREINFELSNVLLQFASQYSDGCVKCKADVMAKVIAKSVGDIIDCAERVAENENVKFSSLLDDTVKVLVSADGATLRAFVRIANERNGLVECVVKYASTLLTYSKDDDCVRFFFSGIVSANDTEEA